MRKQKEEKEKNNEAGWAGWSWELGLGPWPISVIGKTFLFFYKLFLNRNLF
jgi:hypothetical protein